MNGSKALWLIGGLAVLMALAAVGLEWLNSGARSSDSPGGSSGHSPYDVVTTFKRDPVRSRAFAWYTADPGQSGVLQIVEGDDASLLESGQAIRVEAASSELKTADGVRGVHKAEAAGLKPGTAYTDRVGSGLAGEWSEAARFITAKDNADSVTFINVTDSQGEKASDFVPWGKTMGKAFETFPNAEFIIHNGDFTENPQDPGLWNDLLAPVQKLAAVYPLMPVLGNNDIADGDISAYLSHFNLPGNGAEGTEPGTSYSFDYGPVHVTVLNTESDIKKQTEWLRGDLAGTDKLWKIVAMHRPAYGGNSYKKIEDWIPVFDEYGVDLVLQGHNHEYSRSYPLLDGKIAQGKLPEGESPEGAKRGTVYVTVNASGRKFNEKKEDQFYHAVHFQNDKPMFAGITVTEDGLVFQAYDVDGRKWDEFTLKHGGLGD